MELRDVTDEHAVIGIWGPRAREVLAAVSERRRLQRRAALPRGAATIAIGGVAVLAQRITFVGELGYELYVAPEWAVQVWDRPDGRRRRRTGSAPAATACSSRCGSRRATATFGTRPDRAPTRRIEGGVGFCVARDKDAFIGAAALARARRPRAPRLRTLLVGDGPEYLLPLRRRGGAPRRRGRRPRAQLRLRASPLGRNVALATLPPELADRAQALEVEVLGEPVAAEVAADVLYDPENLRLTV